MVVPRQDGRGGYPFKASIGARMTSPHLSGDCFPTHYLAFDAIRERGAHGIIHADSCASRRIGIDENIDKYR